MRLRQTTILAQRSKELLVKSGPAQLWVPGRATGNLAEVRHQVFDFAPNRAGPQHFDSVAHQLVVSAESKRDSSAKHSTCRCKKRCRKGILGAGMNRVGARPTLDRKPGVASFD